jgi:ABC-type multidrug transport system ATPase subunit
VYICIGIIEPGTLTLVLAPPGHGKSIFMKMLAGRLNEDKNCSGTIKWNGKTSAELSSEGMNLSKLCAFVDQGDIHMSLLTVRETFLFVQQNSIADINLLNDPEIKLLHEQRVDLMIELLGLQECQHTIVGNQMLRGVSGGQKKRVTLGETLLTNARSFFLDEISTGLDSATTFDIISALSKWAKLTNSTIVISLLQPPPETFDTFDSLILLREGSVVYHGPRSEVISYFAKYDIRPPQDQDVADFLTEFLTDPKMIYLRNQNKIALLQESRYLSKTKTTIYNTEPTLLDDTDSLPSSDSNHSLQSSSSILSASGLSALTRTTSFNPPLTTTTLVSEFQSSNIYQDMLNKLNIYETIHSNDCKSQNMSKFTEEQYYKQYSYSMYQHTKLCLIRQMTLLSRNKAFLAPRLIQAVIFGLLLGTVYFNLAEDNISDRFGLILYCCIYVSFGNMVIKIYIRTAKIWFYYFI